MLNSADSESNIARWVDATWNSKYMSGAVNYWMGWGCVFLGAYLLALWLVETFTTHISTDLFTYVGTLVTGAMFFGVGVLGISMARNLAHRARVIDYLDDGFRIEFWWRARRSDIEFTVDELESIESCPKEKSFIKLLANLPREPICYQIQVRDQSGFIVTGTDESIHDVVKRFSEKRQQGI